MTPKNLRWTFVTAGLLVLVACEHDGTALLSPSARITGQAEADRGMPHGDTVAPDRPAQPWPVGCVDADGDRWPVCPVEVDFPLDCDDDEPLVRPRGDEYCNDRDDDCDGDTDEDITGCDSPLPPGQRPDEGVEAPGDARPRPPWPGGCVDIDGDRWPTCADPVAFPIDCDDTDEMIRPGADEYCNGIDDDCDGVSDEGITGCANNPQNPPLPPDPRGNE